MNFTELFQTNLRRLRKKSGMTQGDFAQKLDVGRNTIANWETGVSTPGPDAFDAIAKALHVPVYELFLPEELSQQSRATKSVQESLMTLMEYTQNKLREDMQKLNISQGTIDLFDEKVTKKVPPSK